MPYPSTGVNTDPRNYFQQMPQYPYYGQLQYPISYPTQMPQQTTQNHIPVIQNLDGRVVSSANEITPNEVPMNGSVSYFPLKDGSGIIGKKWNSDGTIDTVEFKLVEKREGPSNMEVTSTSVDEKLDEILSILTAPQPISNANRRTAIKKDE